jgi:ribosomal-protein-alanine N-acetyltransferase
MSAVVSQPLPVLRLMGEVDLPDVLSIERASYEFPWTEAIFLDCLRVGYYCLVYGGHRTVQGYGIMSMGAGECHLLNICIHPDHRAQGLGSNLINHLLEVARQAFARVALLEVRVSNTIAYELYYRMGFNEIGVRRDYYPARRGREDALLLARELS